ncbi:MAG: hypothetical protein JWQ55_6136 [Rhodopila sp.]|nr:hypothetical protein [Rhodopila sp.]
MERQIQWARPKLFGFEDISLRVKESRAESKAGRPAQTKLAVGSRHGAPSKALTTCAAAGARYEPKRLGTVDHGGADGRRGVAHGGLRLPYTGLTANGLARHTGSAFSGDVTAPGERRRHLERSGSRLA